MNERRREWIDYDATMRATFHKKLAYEEEVQYILGSGSLELLPRLTEAGKEVILCDRDMTARRAARKTLKRRMKAMRITLQTLAEEMMLGISSDSEEQEDNEHDDAVDVDDDVDDEDDIISNHKEIEDDIDVEA